MADDPYRLRPASPTIERMFRFIEMIGIIALIGAVMGEPDHWSTLVTNCLGFLAVFYLVEPLSDWIAYRIITAPKPTTTQIGITAALTISLSVIAWWSMEPFVTTLAATIRQLLIH